VQEAKKTRPARAWKTGNPASKTIPDSHALCQTRKRPGSPRPTVLFL
jgi:hypothetical protein